MEKEFVMENLERNIREAFRMREKAYAPYSHFRVGAMLAAKNGRTFGGCNVENASYGASNCSERTAVFRAVAEGETAFSGIVIVGGPEQGEPDFCPPCGICRQVLREFCDPECFEVVLAKSESEYRIFTLAELLPESFGPEALER